MPVNPAVGVAADRAVHFVVINRNLRGFVPLRNGYGIGIVPSDLLGEFGVDLQPVLVIILLFCHQIHGINSFFKRASPVRKQNFLAEMCNHLAALRCVAADQRQLTVLADRAPVFSADGFTVLLFKDKVRFGDVGHDLRALARCVEQAVLKPLPERLTLRVREGIEDFHRLHVGRAEQQFFCGVASLAQADRWVCDADVASYNVVFEKVGHRLTDCRLTAAQQVDAVSLADDLKIHFLQVGCGTAVGIPDQNFLGIGRNCLAASDEVCVDLQFDSAHILYPVSQPDGQRFYRTVGVLCAKDFEVGQIDCIGRRTVIVCGCSAARSIRAAVFPRAGGAEHQDRHQQCDCRNERFSHFRVFHPFLLCFPRSAVTPLGQRFPLRLYHYTTLKLPLQATNRLNSIIIRRSALPLLGIICNPSYPFLCAFHKGLRETSGLCPEP